VVDKAGLVATYLLVASWGATDADIDSFGDVLKNAPASVLGYCRSGARGATLWLLHEVQMRTLPEMLAAMNATGTVSPGVWPTRVKRQPRPAVSNSMSPSSVALRRQQVFVQVNRACP